MKINCLACGHNVDISDDYWDYEGLIKCFGCSALLKVKIDDGNIKSVNFSSFPQEKDEEIEIEKLISGK